MVHNLDDEVVKKIRRAAHSYDQYSGCSQSVLLALQEGLGIGDIESFKAATVLSGGVARRGETCGAILGGLMALGLYHGRDDMTNYEQYASAMIVADEICQDFQRRLQQEFCFKKKLDSCLCKDIQQRIYGRSYILKIPEQRKAFLKAGGHSDEGCYKVCGIAAEVTTRKLLELNLGN